VSAALELVIRTNRGSDGEATRALYRRLDGLGAAGAIGVELFRAQKSSERAKVYRGRRHRDAAYDRKGWALDNLCAALTKHAGALGLVWGWGEDAAAPVYRHVLYIDLPTGQVSFHAGARGAGPDYGAAWDGMPGQSAYRIIRFVARQNAGRHTLFAELLASQSLTLRAEIEQEVARATLAGAMARATFVCLYRMLSHRDGVPADVVDRELMELGC
jgi:hypothetical protein